MGFARHISPAILENSAIFRPKIFHLAKETAGIFHSENNEIFHISRRAARYLPGQPAG